MSEVVRRYIVCYDICHPKRLRRIHRIVCDYAIRVQFSVYEAELTLKKLNALVDALTNEMNDLEDSLIIFRGYADNLELNFGRISRFKNGLLLF